MRTPIRLSPGLRRLARGISHGSRAALVLVALALLGCESDGTAPARGNEPPPPPGPNIRARDQAQSPGVYLMTGEVSEADLEDLGVKKDESGDPEEEADPAKSEGDPAE